MKRYDWSEIARDPKLWSMWLWNAMRSTGRGFRVFSMRHTGKTMQGLSEPDRRRDKIEGSTKLSRRLAMRCQIA